MLRRTLRTDQASWARCAVIWYFTREPSMIYGLGGRVGPVLGRVGAPLGRSFGHLLGKVCALQEDAEIVGRAQAPRSRTVPSGSRPQPAPNGPVTPLNRKGAPGRPFPYQVPVYRVSAARTRAQLRMPLWKLMIIVLVDLKLHMKS